MEEIDLLQNELDLHLKTLKKVDENFSCRFNQNSYLNKAHYS